ncbi:MAG TPA: glycoside hydrolase family 20 zincin-like fold domain-containing protein [Terracidiphilus sp.]|nr:glycoside hydrolase family 20 zincin-like fold domain-containing protein [Terracidiphilus sp.]
MIPQPQKVSLEAEDLSFGDGWQLRLSSGVSANGVAVESLREGLSERFHVTLAPGGKPFGVLSLRIAAGSVRIGQAQDNDKNAIEEQAYRIELHPGDVTITANAPIGLFYGVDTLVQMLSPKKGTLWLPEGTIEDWPDLQLRQIYWDDAHHLEKMAELKRAMKQAAFYKINGFVIKLDGHFQYKSAPAAVEPYALSPAQLQELTDYGLRYHIELIPYLDGPAHIAFLLKHPEYASLREFPDSDFEICATNPGSYKLLEGMYQDLLDANRGVKHFFLSTDEPYYLGLANNSQCNETEMAKSLGSVGQVFAHFVKEAAGYLHERGRTVMIWGEYPLNPSDIRALPPYIVNGEVYGPAFDQEFRRRGIKQTIFTSTEGEEKLFPDYFMLPETERLHPLVKDGPDPDNAVPRVTDVMKTISFDSSRVNASLIGTVDCGWGDMGLHPETFWMGYVAGGAAAWHPGTSPEELMNTFYPLFYGPGAKDMDTVYRMMSYQAQLWSDLWDTGPSNARTPIWGGPYEIYKTPIPATDQTLPLPPALSADLTYHSEWSAQNARRTQLAVNALPSNAALRALLKENIVRAEFNRYNLEVYLSIVDLYRQNLEMISEIHDMDVYFIAADHAKASDPEAALKYVDLALDTATSVWRERNEVLQNAVTTWSVSWLPRVPEANGRQFLHQLDDVKDHLPDRTVDMSYLVYRETRLPFGNWVNSIAAARDQYATAHRLPLRNYRLSWDDLGFGSPNSRVPNKSGM